MARPLNNILTKKFLYKEYIINKKSMRQIAKETKFGKTTIEYYLKKYSIKTRSISEALMGKIRSIIVCNKISKTRIQQKSAKGKNNHFYKHGETLKIHYCIEEGCNNKISYVNWRKGNKRCQSCAKLLIWQNKEYKEKTLKALFKAWNLSPNKPEKLLIKLLNKLLPKQYTFVGDGKLILGGFCPDFVNKKNNKIIELYGDYWHNLPDYKKRDKRRLISYKALGYKTLIIWEHELKNLDKVKTKILWFNSRGDK